MRKNNRWWLCCLIPLLLLSSCGETPGAFSVALKEAARVKPGAGVHHAGTLQEDTLQAKAGFTELFWDRESQSPVIRAFAQTGSPVLWHALPPAAETAAVFSADVIVNGRRLTLNSQDHAVAFRSPKLHPLFDPAGIQSGLEAQYLLCLDQETAQKKVFSEADVAFLIRMQFTLDGGDFYTTLSWQNLSKNPDAFLETITVMEAFGGLHNPEPEDFLLLPDGVGALFHPARHSTKTAALESQPLTFRVYAGKDTQPPETLRANLGAFGGKQGKRAFVGVIESGAVQADILLQQQIPVTEGTCSTVGSRFRATEVTESTDGEITARAQKQFGRHKANQEPEIRLCYRFFVGESANFNTMAQAVREQMIDSGLLSSTRTVSAQEEEPLPLHITLTGRSGKQVSARYEEAQDLLSRLKHKGVDALVLRYRAGLHQNAKGALRADLGLGGKRDRLALQAFCDAQNLHLFWEVPLLTARTQNGAQTLTGERLPLRRVQDTQRAARAVLESLGASDGVSVLDAAANLYADSGKPGATRADLTARFLGLLPAFSAKWKILSGGDLSTARFADVVMDLPTTTQMTMAGGRYTAVPLLPMILHGTTEYSGPPLNFEKDPETAFLRSVSFGAVPSWSWTTRQNTQDYFETDLDQVLTRYRRANAVLAERRNQRIVSWSAVENVNVTVTRFLDGSELYVNFDALDRTVNGIFLPSRDFVLLGKK